MTALRILRLTLPRYVSVGAVCATLNVVLMIVLDAIGIDYLRATMIAFVPVLVVGYLLHSACTFQADVSWASFARYTLAMLTNYPLWLACLYVLVDGLNMRIAPAAPLTTLVLFAWNYIVSLWALDQQFRSMLGIRTRNP